MVVVVVFIGLVTVLLFSEVFFDGLLLQFVVLFGCVSEVCFGLLVCLLVAMCCMYQLFSVLRLGFVVFPLCCNGCCAGCCVCCFLFCV